MTGRDGSTAAPRGAKKCARSAITFNRKVIADFLTHGILQADSPGAPQRCSHCLVPLLAAREPLLAALGSLLGHSGAAFGALLAALGASWAALEALLGCHKYSESVIFIKKQHS